MWKDSIHVANGKCAPSEFNGARGPPFLATDRLTPLGDREYFGLFQLNQLLRPLQGALFNVHIFQRCFTVHVPELLHHDFQRYAGFSPLSAKSVAQIVEAKAFHAASLHELPP